MGYPLIHPDYLDQVLTRKQWLDWRLLWLTAPWGEEREDLRVEHVRLREMNSRCEHPSNELTHEYPYVIVPKTVEEVRATQKQMEEGLEQYINAQGKVAHRWKPGHGKP